MPASENGLCTSTFVVVVAVVVVSVAIVVVGVVVVVVVVVAFANGIPVAKISWRGPKISKESQCT